MRLLLGLIPGGHDPIDVLMLVLLVHGSSRMARGLLVPCDSPSY